MVSCSYINASWYKKWITEWNRNILQVIQVLAIRFECSKRHGTIQNRKKYSWKEISSIPIRPDVAVPIRSELMCDGVPLKIMLSIFRLLRSVPFRRSVRQLFRGVYLFKNKRLRNAKVLKERLMYFRLV